MFKKNKSSDCFTRTVGILGRWIAVLMHWNSAALPYLTPWFTLPFKLSLVNAVTLGDAEQKESLFHSCFLLSTNYIIHRSHTVCLVSSYYSTSRQKGWIILWKSARPLTKTEINKWQNEVYWLQGLGLAGNQNTGMSSVPVTGGLLLRQNWGMKWIGWHTNKRYKSDSHL